MYQYLHIKYHLHTYDIGTGIYMFIHPLLIHTTNKPTFQFYEIYSTRQIPVVKASADIILQLNVRDGISNLVDCGNWWFVQFLCIITLIRVMQ